MIEPITTSNVVEPSLPPRIENGIRKLFETRIPFNVLLGLKIDTMTREGVSASFGMQPQLVGNFTHGILHGGVTAAVLDAVAGTAIYTSIAFANLGESIEASAARFGSMSTIDLRIDYLRPGRGQRFVAHARVLRLGKKIASTRMELIGDDGQLIAAGAAAFYVG